LFESTISRQNAQQSPGSLVVSVAIHGLAILLVLVIRFSGVVKFPAAPQHFTLIAPAKLTPITLPKVQLPRRREFHPAPPVQARLELPVAMIAAPPIEIPKPAAPEIPHAAPPVAISIPVVKPSGFAETKPVAPVPAPKLALKAAGFENSETSTDGPVRHTSATMGGFESAHSAEGAPARRAIAGASGFSESSTGSSSTGARRGVTSAAFGDTSVEKGTAAPRQAAAAARFTPVEILSKPKPAYTAEARSKKIEGEVLLEVLFNISGEVRVLRVVRGLGYGLDETAIAAAQGIHFRPATREGSAADSTALMHIVFQVAN
jgi:TonB family protein